MPGAPASTSARVGGWLSDQPYLLLSLTSLFWAGNTVLGRFVVGHIPPMTLAFGRWAGAFDDPVAVRGRPPAARLADHPQNMPEMMTLLAFTGFSAYNTMAYYGLQYTTAINGLLLQSIGPLFVALWTFALFGDRLTLRQAGGICVLLSGVIVIICHGSLAILLGIAFNQGDVWFVVALAFYGFYMAILRKRPPIHPLSFLAAGMGGGAVLLIPLVALEILSGRTMVFDAESFPASPSSAFSRRCRRSVPRRGIELIGADRAARSSISCRCSDRCWRSCCWASV